jgi:hypothetical protein
VGLDEPRVQRQTGAIVAEADRRMENHPNRRDYRLKDLLLGRFDVHHPRWYVAPEPKIGHSAIACLH